MASIICRYLDGTTEICNNTYSYMYFPYLSDIKVNGVSIGLTTTYNVSSSDEVEFVCGPSCTVGAYMFYQTKVANVVIGSGVRGINEKAFRYCNSLQSVTLGKDVMFLSGDYIFGSCSSLTEFIIESPYITVDGSNVFRSLIGGGMLYCSEIFNYEDFVNSGFPSSWVANRTIPDFSTKCQIVCEYDTVRNIDGTKKLTWHPEYFFDIRVNGKSIGLVSDYALEDDDVVLFITKHNGLMGEFANTFVKKVVLDDNIEYLSDGAFYNDTYLQSITLGESVNYLGSQAFGYCDDEFSEIFCKSPVVDVAEDGFLPIKRNGTFYKASGTTGLNYLFNTGDTEYIVGTIEYYNWNVTEMNPDDMPSIEDYDFTEFSLQSYDYLIFDAAGGTQLVDVSVNGTVSGSLSWRGTLDDYGSREFLGEYNDNPITVIYAITMDANDDAARTTYFTVTGTDSTGSANKIITIYQKDNNGNLPNDFNEDMSTGCYINLDSYEYTFPATGGTYFVRAEFGYPAANSGLKTRVFSGSVYPIAWCTTELNGGEVDDDGTEANEVWKITMLENTGDVRECSVSFSYTNSYGESTSVVFTAKQAAAEGEEDSDPLVSAFTTSAKVNADGTPVIPSFTSIRCGYNKVTVLTPTVYYDGGSTADWITLGAGSVVNGTFIGYDEVREYPISFAVNKGTARTGKIIFSGTDASGNTLTSICSIAQAIADAGEDPEIPDTPTDSDEITFAPIWRDTVYTFGGTDVVYGIYVESRVYVGGQWITYDELLFKGRAYAKPNETVVNVMINKICQNYLNTIDTLFNGAVGIGNPFRMFKLKNDYGTLLHTYYFVGDWSYSPLTLGVKTNPITPYIGDGQKLFFSTLAQEQQTVKWGMRYYNGTADYDNTEYLTNDYMTNIVTESRQKGVDTFYINDKEYNVLPKCQCKWVLYYLNPFGGYDWFALTGRVKRNDRLETYTITQNYNNTTSEFGKKRYLSTINVNYQINTQWLTQGQSDRMWELIESNQVWLHNLETNEIMPVIITDTEVEHKQKTNLNRMISYQINVELSQGRERM